jgi:hypothetical protein
VCSLLLGVHDKREQQQGKVMRGVVHPTDSSAADSQVGIFVVSFRFQILIVISPRLMTVLEAMVLEASK